MQIVKTPESARAAARALPRPLGFVPTMGALHAGHFFLFSRALRENASLAVSLFVNPLQFGPNEDFARYPRSFESDAAECASIGVDLLYAPPVEAMYPAGFSTTVDPGPVGAPYEGAARLGHFAGVATVVAKLLASVEPTRLYLGQKDAQQIAVLRRMIRDLDIPTEVVVCDTMREGDGLALSSRNAYLNAEERQAAPTLYLALEEVANGFARGRSTEPALASGRGLLQAPLQWEYLAVVDPATFEVRRTWEHAALVVGAVRARSTRLIDNYAVKLADGTDSLVTRPLETVRIV